MSSALCVGMTTTGVKLPMYADWKIISIFPAWRNKQWVYRVKFKRTYGEINTILVAPRHIEWVVSTFQFEDLTKKHEKT